MTISSQIFGVWILDLDSKVVLIQKMFREGNFDIKLLKDFLFTIVSFDREGLEEKLIDSFILGEYKVIYEIFEDFVFAILVNKEYDSINAKRILSHVRVTFFRKFPVRDCNWLFNPSMDHFSSFEDTIDNIIENFRTTKIIVKFVLMGLDYAGKTTLTHAFAESEYLEYLPTTGLDILRIEYRNIQLRIWDLGGQKPFRVLWPKFTYDASGIIYVLDSTTDRWTEVKEVFENCKSYNKPFIVFANKQDIVDLAKDVKFIAKTLDISEEKIILGSALLNENVFEVLDRLLEEIFQSDLTG